MSKELSARLHEVAARLQRLGLALSALFGGLVGLAFAAGSSLAWQFAFGGFVSLLWVGMAVVVISAVSQRIPSGAWQLGLGLSSRIFLAQATIYGAMMLALSLTPSAAAGMPVARLALAMLPGLYICNLLAILISTPLYLEWLPIRHDR